MLLEAIAQLAPAGVDPFTDAGTLAQAVSLGLLDAPHLRGNAAACGKIVTRMIGGACLAVDPETGKPLREAERTARALEGSGGRAMPNRQKKRTTAVQLAGAV